MVRFGIASSLVSALFALIGSIPGPGAGEIDRQAVSARFERLQRIKVDYDVVYRARRVTTEMSTLRKGARAVLLPSNYAKRVSFTYMDGLARWDTVLSADATSWSQRNQIVMSPQTSEAYDGVVHQELSQHGKSLVGALIPGERGDHWWPVELGLGLRLSERGVWITSALLSRMTLGTADHDKIKLSYTDSGPPGQTYDWVFDRKMAYALVAYRRKLKESVIVEVIPSMFKDVEGLILPLKVEMKYLDDSGTAATTFTATVIAYDLKVDRQPRIEFPKNTVFLDGRTQREYIVRRDKQVITDAVLAKAALASPDDSNAPVIPRVRPPRSTPTAPDRAFGNRLTSAGWAVLAGLLALVALYVLAYTRRRRGI